MTGRCALALFVTALLLSPRLAAAETIREGDTLSGQPSVTELGEKAFSGCPGRPINCGQTVFAALEFSDCAYQGGGNYVDLWEFAGQPGQQVTITQRSTAFDSYLVLYSPSNAVSAFDDDSGSGTDAQVSFTIPQTGAWTIGATSYELAVGSYSLSLACSNQPLSAQIVASLASNSVIRTGFGWSAAASATTVVVGAPRDNSVFVFEKDQGGVNRWGLKRRLVASDRSTSNSFGWSVAIDGETIIVGDVDGGARGSGAAYVFERNRGGAGQWGQAAKIVPSDPSFLDFFGGAVAIRGSTVVVGAAIVDAAYIYSRGGRSGTSWVQTRKLRGIADSFFGTAVAVSGDLVLVGANAAQSAYLFARNQGGKGNWGLAKTLRPGEAAGDFGAAVALASGVALVGAPGYDRDFNEGAAYVYQTNHGGPNAWGKVVRLQAPDQYRARKFGHSVALLGDLALVGARPLYQSGSASFFIRGQGGLNRWGTVGTFTNSDGTFGSAVALANGVAVIAGEQNERASVLKLTRPGAP